MVKVFYFLHSKIENVSGQRNPAIFVKVGPFGWGVLFLLMIWIGFSHAQEKPGVNQTTFGDRPTGNFFMSDGLAFHVTFEKWEPATDRLFFQKKGKFFSFEPSSFLFWGAPMDASPLDFTFVLTDGSYWVGAPQNPEPEQKPERIALETAFCGTLSFSADEMAGILFPGLPIPLREKLLTEASSTDFNEDVLVFKTGERISGEYLGIDENSVLFGTRELNPEKSQTLFREIQVIHPSQYQIAALFFSDALRLKPSQRSTQKFFWLGLTDGSLIRFEPGRNLFDFQNIPPEEIVYLESPQTSQRFFNESITSTAQKIAELRWLDELEPVEVPPENPMVSPFPCRWKIGAEPSDERLRSRKMIFRHGISVIAGTALNWTLDGTFQKMGVLPLFADSENENEETELPEVRCRIRIDGKIVAEQVLEKNSKMKIMVVSLENASNVTLETILVSDETELHRKPVVNWLNGFLVP